MKDKVLTLLTTKFEGVSSQILDRVASKLAKGATTEEEAQELVDNYTFANLLEAYGDSRATEASKAAVANYKAKHSNKPDQTDTSSDPDTTSPDATPDWAKALIASTKALQDKVAAMEGEKTAANRRAIINKAVEKLPESLRKAYERIPVDTMNDEDFSSMASDIANEVDTIAKDMKTAGAVFKAPFGATQTQSNQATEKEIADAVSKLNF